MSSSTSAPVQASIERKLRERLRPAHLEIINDSHKHNVPPNSETHFTVLVVSSAFDSVTPLERHRLVNDALKDELAGPVHALSIKAKTPAAWAKAGGAVDTSTPNCRGGSGK